jgi:hypothetical protein
MEDPSNILLRDYLTFIANAQINLLHAILEVGHEVDTMEKVQFVTLSMLQTLGKAFRPVRWKNFTAEEKIK